MKRNRRLMSLLQFSKATGLSLEAIVKAIQRKRFAAEHGVVGELPKIDVEIFDLRYRKRRGRRTDGDAEPRRKPSA